MAEFGSGVSIFTVACLLFLFVIGAFKVGQDIQLSSQCEFVNAAQSCYKVFLPENHEYFKEY